MTTLGTDDIDLGPATPAEADHGRPGATPAVSSADALDELLGGYEGMSGEDTARLREQDRAVAAAAASALPPESMVPRRMRDAATARDEERTGLWLLWWIPSVLVPPFGGVVAWYALRFTHRRAALAMFATGVVIGLVGAFVLARFATPIAAWVVGTSRDTVIVLPSKTITP